MGLYKRGGVWYASYFLKGKRIRKAIGKNKKKAEAELEAIRTDIRGGRYKEPRRDPFETLVDDYEKGRAGLVWYQTEKYYIQRIREFFKGRIVQDIGVRDVEQFKDYIEALPLKNTKRKRGAGDINHHLISLSAMFRKAIKWEWVEENPASGEKVEREELPPGRNSYLTVEQVAKLLDACTPHLRPIVLCAVETGMRKSEILGLRWSEIRRVPVEEGNNASTVEVIFLPAHRTKNGKAREIPVSDVFSAELKRQREAQKSSRVVSLTDLVFRPPQVRRAIREGKIQPVSGPLRDIEGAWRTAKRKAKIPEGFHFHDLRHTFASHAKMQGVDDYTLMAIMGHQDFKMMARYAHLDVAHKIAAIGKLPMWHKSGTPGTVEMPIPQVNSHSVIAPN